MFNYEDFFKKIYCFKTDEHFIVPSQMFDSPKWFLPKQLNKKIKLNEVKGLLGKYKLKVWSKHTAYRDPSGFVMKNLAENVQPELLTQAWCKFYEILCQFPVISPLAILHGIFTSLHLCEAPGAFVCALNHYLKQNYPNIQWNWTASTLNPNYEGNELSQMIPDDRLIRYTLKNWHFGLDLTGDITKYYNHNELTESFRYSKVELVTADGSVDCMKDPGEQESHVAFLHFCETISALAVLQKGGTFVLKIFTMFEDTTICLMYLLTCLFESVSVFKPCTSKSGNSEVYVINTNYKGIDLLSNIWDKLITVYKDKDLFSTHSMFYVSDLPESFLEDINQCTDFFMTKQIHTISNNIYYFENKIKSESSRVYLLKSSIAAYYMSLYNPMWISNNKKIVPSIAVGDNWRVHAVRNTAGFTCILTEDLLKLSPEKYVLDIKIGKRIETVQNSKFMQKDNLQKIQSVLNSEKELLLYNLVLKGLEKNNIIINLKEFDVRQYYIFQKNFFYRVYNSLKSGLNIIFINVPFHTHFLVGLLYILFFAFEKVYFGSGVIILYKSKAESLQKVKEILHCIDAQYNELNKNSENGFFERDIIQIIPPGLFDETYSSLVGLLWNYNNQLLVNKTSIT